MAAPALAALAMLLLYVPLGASSYAGQSQRAASHDIRPAVPEGLGVNIHFTDPKPGEMDMIAQAGCRVVRMDFTWGGTERQPGQYDFSRYETLLAALEPHGIRALFILDYTNRLYDENLSPHTDAGRQAFARWAAAAASHFRGRGILWEMYNEPNIKFWKPEPNVRDYVLLALEVGKAIRQAAPHEAYVGPATSGIDMAFLEECFKAGLLEYWSAVTVHPYRQEPPETVVADYGRLRQLIDKYAPKGKTIPIISGEWGYSSVWRNQNDEKQGKYLSRQWLVNLACDVPVSIWYDWHDDGQDPKEPEHHFGTVAFPYYAGRDPVYDPKPAYRAAATLTTVLSGYRFSKRLVAGGADDWVLLFGKGDEVRLAAWTTAASPREVVVPASPGRFAVTSHTGETLPAVTAGAAGLPVILTDSPQYLVPEGPNDVLRLAAAWQTAPLQLAAPGGRELTLPLTITNPLDRPVRLRPVGQGHETAKPVDVQPGRSVILRHVVYLRRSSDPLQWQLEWDVEGIGRLSQQTRVIATNPLTAAILPACGKSVAVRIENPSGNAFKGRVLLTDVEGLRLVEPTAPVILGTGQREKTVHFILGEPVGQAFRLGVRIEDEKGKPQATVGGARYRLVDDFSRLRQETLAEVYELVADGDAKVASSQSLEVSVPPEGPPAPGVVAIKMAYSFDDGWKFLRLSPRDEAVRAIDGRPRGLGLWVWGDGTGSYLRARVVDSTGQTFQPSGERIRWKGWRYVFLPLDGTRSGHWGGANDGQVHYPIRWDTLVLVDSADRRKTQGEIYVAWPVLVE